ncbi:MAG TPA: hypothetical protein VIK18_25915, partial [Pirellulales bacterium]
ELADLFLLVLHRAASRQEAGAPLPDVVRVPSPEGRLWMPIEERRTAGRGMSADLNAAANLGLQPLLDADWPGSWSHVPTISGQGSGRRADPERCQGAACVGSWQVEPMVSGGFAAIEHQNPADPPLEADLRRFFMLELGLPVEFGEPDVPAAPSSSEAALPVIPRKRGRPPKAPQPRQQPYLNLWRDYSSAALNSGVWRTYADYSRFVLARALGLWLKSDPAFENTPPIGGQFVLR